MRLLVVSQVPSIWEGSPTECTGIADLRSAAVHNSVSEKMALEVPTVLEVHLADGAVVAVDGTVSGAEVGFHCSFAAEGSSALSTAVGAAFQVPTSCSRGLHYS